MTAATAGQPTLAELGAQVGKNKIGINFVWVLITGYLVMFMQAGFALSRNGLHPREKRRAYHGHEYGGLRVGRARVLCTGFRVDVRRRER